MSMGNEKNTTQHPPPPPQMHTGSHGPCQFCKSEEFPPIRWAPQAEEEVKVLQNACGLGLKQKMFPFGHDK